MRPQWLLPSFTVCRSDRIRRCSSTIWKPEKMEKSYGQERLWFVYTIQAFSGVHKWRWAFRQAKSPGCLTGVFGKINVLWWGGFLVFFLFFCISYIELHLSSIYSAESCWVEKVEQKIWKKYFCCLFKLWPSDIFIRFSQLPVSS